jgi:hypothetical protein
MKGTEMPEDIDDAAVDASAELGGKLSETLFAAAAGYEMLEENVHHDAILFPVWVSLTRYLADVGWTPDELSAELQHHVGVARAN